MSEDSKELEAEMTLEQAIEKAAEHLPEGFMVEIHVENGSALVTLFRPDGSEVMMDDGAGEIDFAEQIMAALRLIRDESQADTMLSNNRL